MFTASLFLGFAILLTVPNTLLMLLFSHVLHLLNTVQLILLFPVTGALPDRLSLSVCPVCDCLVTLWTPLGFLHLTLFCISNVMVWFDPASISRGSHYQNYDNNQCCFHFTLPPFLPHDRFNFILYEMNKY